MASQEHDLRATVNQARDRQPPDNRELALQAMVNPELDHPVTANPAPVHQEEIVPTRAANQVSNQLPTLGLRPRTVPKPNPRPKTAPPRNLVLQTPAAAKAKADQPHNRVHPPATVASHAETALQGNNSHLSQQLTAIFLT
jgi:hypothetical protein